MIRKPHAKELARGSIFILVLMVLLLVTFIGISLVFITETEMQLGGTDRVITTTFYAAESGLHAAVGGVQNQNWEGEDIVFVDGPLYPDRLIGTRVSTSRVHAVGDAQLPPMSLANENENEFWTFSIVMNSVAQRVSWPDDEKVPIYDDNDPRELDVTIQSERVLNVRLFISPIRSPATGEKPYNDKDATPQ